MAALVQLVRSKIYKAYRLLSAAMTYGQSANVTTWPADRV